MTDRRRAYTSSIMTAKKNGASLDRRGKYDEAFKAEARRQASESRSTLAAARQLGLGISPKLFCRWSQAQLVVEVDSEEVVRDPEVRARLKQAEQGLAIFKKALVIFDQPIR